MIRETLVYKAMFEHNISEPSILLSYIKGESTYLPAGLDSFQTDVALYQGYLQETSALPEERGQADYLQLLRILRKYVCIIIDPYDYISAVVYGLTFLFSVNDGYISAVCNALDDWSNVIHGVIQPLECGDASCDEEVVNFLKHNPALHEEVKKTLYKYFEIYPVVLIKDAIRVTRDCALPEDQIVQTCRDFYCIEGSIWAAVCSNLIRLDTLSS